MIKEIVEYINKGGGAVQFHAIGELCVMTFDEKYNKTNQITEIFDDINMKQLDVNDEKILTKIYNEIKQHGRK